MESTDMEHARQAAAQAWSTESNKSKNLDPELAEAFANILANHIGFAREFANNMEYYRSLLDKCAELIGEDAFVCDDGSKSASPLRAKIPELVAEMVSQIEARDPKE